MNRIFRYLFLWASLLSLTNSVLAQRTLQGDGGAVVGGNMTFNSKGMPVRKNTDTSFQHRDFNADTVNINYRYFDKSKTYILDSTINDFIQDIHYHIITTILVIWVLLQNHFF